MPLPPCSMPLFTNAKGSLLSDLRAHGVPASRLLFSESPLEF
jgi:hypothetical protein